MLPPPGRPRSSDRRQWRHRRRGGGARACRLFWARWWCSAGAGPRSRCSAVAGRPLAPCGPTRQDKPRLPILATRHRGARGEGPAERQAPPAARRVTPHAWTRLRSEEHTSELQSLAYLVCRLLLEKKKKKSDTMTDLPTQRFTQYAMLSSNATTIAHT